MNRPALRYLALGFLLSALVLSGYRLFFYEPATSTNKTEQTAKSKDENLSKSEKSYKKKYEELLTKIELEKVTDKTDSSSTTDSSAADSSAKKEEPAKDTDKKEEVKKYTLVIGQGDPTSTAVDQLAANGIIKDANEFTSFLTSNDYEMYIRDGSYEVNSGMSLEEIAKIITHRD
ncbi:MULTISPECIES: hypothetical protein [Carnobacterium]|uniref:hypothetical protein n=1 Tax=Carnobacterium TaxID=2747 RepID=UPI0007F49E69|nr:MULTISPECIES: hypothetical protein [Carnobacterium]MCO6017375.1 endolytic transglycosylase MltG [Carnobacterium divergens]MDT1939210.1 endolytic transglycosylase MltG [Carnobacterium divergens]MDT1941648.1 endolytic transglycosylase MltG [Carnobacterium divergens]MDT1947446.1 endolytic transglycosylase MltG [Carnobacterium divergens]MDT1949885.1 endolytic transglycosylase MltG [Carnobacterium divergens]